MQKRRRIKHEKSFEQRRAEEAQCFREAAKALPPGMARELAEGAAHMNHWPKSTSPEPRDKRVPEPWRGSQTMSLPANRTATPVY
jgi:hypothetical protein